MLQELRRQVVQMNNLELSSKKANKKKETLKISVSLSSLCWARTSDPLINSQML
jgi:hypothetical protein